MDSTSDRIETWELFPSVSVYLGEHGWVYTGAGRWVRRDELLWIKRKGEAFAIEIWDVADMPRLIRRYDLDGISGLTLLFSN